MTVVVVEVRAAEVLRVLHNAERRIRYAVVNSLNGAAKAGQAAERARVASVFTLRKREFVLRQAAIIRPFASVSQQRYQVRVAVGEKRRLLLSTFEKGGVREPFVGKHVAVPVIGGARSSKSQSIPLHLWVQRLRLKRVRSKSGGRGSIRGLERTFIIPRVGIFQRTGGSARPLYIFATGVVRIDPRLRFVETVGGTATREFPGLLRAQVLESFRRDASKFVGGVASSAVLGGVFGALRGSSGAFDFGEPEGRGLMEQTDDVTEAVIDRVLLAEGGRVDRGDDWGGPTAAGVTAKGFADWPDRPAKSHLELTREEVREFYRWLMRSSGCARIPQPMVRWVVFDAVVNHGKVGGVRLLQKALGVKADGVIGPVTLAAVPYLDARQLAVAVVGERLELFGAIISGNYTDADHDGKPDAAENALGWLRRCKRQLREVFA